MNAVPQAVPPFDPVSPAVGKFLIEQAEMIAELQELVRKRRLRRQRSKEGDGTEDKG